LVGFVGLAQEKASLMQIRSPSCQKRRLKPPFSSVRASYWMTISTRRVLRLADIVACRNQQLALALADYRDRLRRRAVADQSVLDRVGTTQRQLAHAVRDRWPPVELLATSALGNVTAKDLPARGRFLSKPYDVATLSETFQQLAGD
jgi:hypothetical protein